MLSEHDTAYDKIFNIDTEGTPIESAGTFEDVAEGLGFKSTNDLKKYIEGKTVLDVGSGMGGLFKEARIRGIKTNILNLNPRFALKGHKEEAHLMYDLGAESIPENMSKINEAHDRASLAALSDNLPFAPASIEIIVDNKAAVYHCLYEDRVNDDYLVMTTFKPNKSILEKTLDEYTRVLAKGGKARIGGLLANPKDGIELLRNVLADKGISYTPITNEQGTTVAIEIEKTTNL